MKIKTISFAGILIAICLLAFIGCDSTITEDSDYAAFNGEYRLIGWRADDEFRPGEGFDFDSLYIFNGTNRSKTKLISTEFSYEYEFEFELNNGKIRQREFNLDDPFCEWSEWANYIFNNDLLEIKIEIKYVPVAYLVYKKI